MGIGDPYLAYVFDEAIAVRAALREQRHIEEAHPNPTAPAGRPGKQATITTGGRILGTLAGRIGEAL